MMEDNEIKALKIKAEILDNLERLVETFFQSVNDGLPEDKKLKHEHTIESKIVTITFLCAKLLDEMKHEKRKIADLEKRVRFLADVAKVKGEEGKDVLEQLARSLYLECYLNPELSDENDEHIGVIRIATNETLIGYLRHQEGNWILFIMDDEGDDDPGIFEDPIEAKESFDAYLKSDDFKLEDNVPGHRHYISGTLFGIELFRLIHLGNVTAHDKIKSVIDDLLVTCFDFDAKSQIHHFTVKD